MPPWDASTRQLQFTDKYDDSVRSLSASRAGFGPIVTFAPYEHVGPIRALGD